MTFQFGFRLFARISSSLLQAVVLVVLARVLGGSVFGQYALAYAVAALSAGLLGVGASTRILRAAMEPNPRALTGSLLVLRASASVVGVALTVGVGLAWGWAASAVLAAAVVGSSELLVDYAQATLAGRDLQTQSAWFVFGQKVVLCAGVVAGALVGPTAALVSLMVVGGVSMVAGVIVVSKFSDRPRDLIRTILESRGYWATALVGNVKHVEPFAVGNGLGEVTAGIYSVVSRLTNPLLIVTAVAQVIYVPKLAAAGSSTKEFIGLFGRVRLIAFGYGALVIVASPAIAWVTLAMLGPDFREHLVLATSIVAAAGVSAMTNLYQIGFYALGRPGAVALSVGVVTGAGALALGVVAATAGESWLWTVPFATQVALLAVISRRYKAFADSCGLL